MSVLERFGTKLLVDNAVGWYYINDATSRLHYKADTGDGPPDGTHVRQFWPYTPNDRGVGWIFLAEALARGCNRDDIMRLAAGWKMDDDDALRFEERTPDLVLVDRAPCDGPRWKAQFDDWTSDESNEHGYGDTALDAMAALIRCGLPDTTIQ